MAIFKKFLNKLNGLRYNQEYLCLARESFQHPLHVYLAENRKIIKDISSDHLFIGYSPLILALYSASEETTDLAAGIDIIFTRQAQRLNEFVQKKDAIARLSLQLIRKQPAGDITISYYEGIKGEHHFVSSFYQYMNSLYNRLYNKKPGNVFLHDNLYKQVQIAYSVPRVISLITVGNGSLYNLFPTDLHGPVGDRYYVSSLRREGKACRQVEEAKRIVVSDILCEAYKTVYSLGKNHMQELRPADNFPFNGTVSEVWQIPLPRDLLHYRELELIESFDHGIHKLLLYKIHSSVAVNPAEGTLAHIHNAYATWLHNKGLSGNYLLR